MFLTILPNEEMLYLVTMCFQFTFLHPTNHTQKCVWTANDEVEMYLWLVERPFLHLHVVIAVDSGLANNTSKRTGHCQQAVFVHSCKSTSQKDKSVDLIDCSQTQTPSLSPSR